MKSSWTTVRTRPRRKPRKLQPIPQTKPRDAVSPGIASDAAANVMYTIQPRVPRTACASCGSDSGGFKFCKVCFGSLPACKSPSCKKKANMNRKYCTYCERRLVTCRSCQRETVNQTNFCDVCFAKFFWVILLGVFAISLFPGDYNLYFSLYWEDRISRNCNRRLSTSY